MKGQISREQVIAKIRELGFSFCRKGDKNELWRRTGTTDFISLSPRKQHPEIYVRTVLTQGGLTAEQINKFLTECVKS